MAVIHQMPWRQSADSLNDRTTFSLETAVCIPGAGCHACPSSREAVADLGSVRVNLVFARRDSRSYLTLTGGQMYWRELLADTRVCHCSDPSFRRDKPSLKLEIHFDVRQNCHRFLVCVAGSNLHCLSASTAASSRPIPRPFSTRIFWGLPSTETTIASTTMPWSLASRAC